MLTKGGQKHYDTYMKAYLESREQPGHRDECFVVDMSQNPQQRFRAGPWIPTMARSSELYCMSCEGGPEKFTPAELQFAHGWPLLATPLGDAFRDCASFDFSCLSPTQQRHLAGNGMHLAVLAAWMLYVKMHLMRVDVLTHISPQITPFDDAAEAAEAAKES